MPILLDEEESIINLSPTEETDDLKPIKVTSNNINTVTIDNRWSPRDSLLTYVEGSVWVVDYYKQIVTRDTELSGQQLSVHSAYQQYKLIKNLQIKVSNPLTSTQDDDKTTTVTGEAVLTGLFIPNDGDMFVADIGDGNLALFTINKTQKMSIYKDSVYQLTYTLMNNDQVYLDDLNTKVVETNYYYHQRLTKGDNPIITNSEFNSVIEIDKQFTTLINYYFNRFFSNEFKTLLVPGQTTSVYDHYIVIALLNEFDTDHCFKIKDIRLMNVQEDNALKSDSVWDAIRNRNTSYLSTSFKQSGLIACNNFSSIPLANGIRFTGIKLAVYPLDNQLTIDNMIKLNTKSVGLDTMSVEDIPVFSLLNTFRGFDELDSAVPDFYELNKDGYYIFSKDFYDNTLNKSRFEKLVMDYIENKPISSEIINDLVINHNKLSLTEQFYYIPIMLIIMKSILRGN